MSLVFYAEWKRTHGGAIALRAPRMLAYDEVSGFAAANLVYCVPGVTLTLWAYDASAAPSLMPFAGVPVPVETEPEAGKRFGYLLRLLGADGSVKMQSPADRETGEAEIFIAANVMLTLPGQRWEVECAALDVTGGSPGDTGGNTGGSGSVDMTVLNAAVSSAHASATNAAAAADAAGEAADAATDAATRAEAAAATATATGGGSSGSSGSGNSNVTHSTHKREVSVAWAGTLPTTRRVLFTFQTWRARPDGGDVRVRSLVGGVPGALLPIHAYSVSGVSGASPAEYVYTVGFVATFGAAETRAFRVEFGDAAATFYPFPAPDLAALLRAPNNPIPLGNCAVYPDVSQARILTAEQLANAQQIAGYLDDGYTEIALPAPLRFNGADVTKFYSEGNGGYFFDGSGQTGFRWGFQDNGRKSVKVSPVAGGWAWACETQNPYNGTVDNTHLIKHTVVCLLPDKWIVTVYHVGSALVPWEPFAQLRVLAASGTHYTATAATRPDENVPGSAFALVFEAGALVATVGAEAAI